MPDAAELDIEQLRRQFPALERTVAGRPVAFFDGPAGSQTPRRVADAVSRYLLETNANHGGPFATSVESDAILDEAHRAAADFLGASDPDCVVFGANMTTLTFALSRALGRTWNDGDEVVVTRLDHDANVTPWTLAARDAGATVRHVGFAPDDCTLDMQEFDRVLSERTRLVAVGYASNIVGTVNPIQEIVERAHQAGALVFVDAVHYAPHRLIDVDELDCDFLAVSAYKFFGPHVGVLYGKRGHLESVEAYKLRPATDDLPGKWMTGTQNHECIAGVAEAVEYLANLGRESSVLTGESSSRRDALVEAFGAIRRHEESLLSRLLDGLQRLPRVRIWGITESSRFNKRVPTVSFTHEKLAPRRIAERLAERGIFVWPGNHYALPFTEAAGLEPGGTVRVGLLHYNTAEEINRLLEELQQIV